MTEPTTPTGKRLWPKDVPEVMADIARETRANVLAIEAEARQQERAAIRAKCSQHNPDHDPRWCRICSDIVDPSDD